MVSVSSFSGALFIAIMLAFVCQGVQLSLSESVRTNSKMVWCRMNEGISRCVDPPVQKKKLPKYLQEELKGGAWCPFRVCGPSYAATEKCTAVDAFKPIGQCSVKTVKTKVYTCMLEYSPNSLQPEDACTALGRKYCGVGAVYICRCKRDNVNQVVYELAKRKAPTCP